MGARKYVSGITKKTYNVYMMNLRTNTKYFQCWGETNYVENHNEVVKSCSFAKGK
jgi:hypothetical protein